MRRDWASIVGAKELERGSFSAIVDGWAREHLDSHFDDWGVDSESPGCVYVVQDQRSGLTKVGTTGALYSRLDALRLSPGTPDWPQQLPRLIALIAHTPGTTWLEHALLHLLQPLRVAPASEWLRSCPSVDSLVQQLGGATLLPSPESPAERLDAITTKWGPALKELARR